MIPNWIALRDEVFSWQTPQYTLEDVLTQLPTPKAKAQFLRFLQMQVAVFGVRELGQWMYGAVNQHYHKQGMLAEFTGTLDLYAGIVQDFAEKLPVQIEFWEWLDTGGLAEAPAAGNMADAKPLQWLWDETQLVYLFERLVKEGAIAKERGTLPFSRIARHFVNKEGKPFANKQLSQTQGNYRTNKDGRPEGANPIDAIVKDVKDNGTP
jgi:hypothetical protein